MFFSLAKQRLQFQTQPRNHSPVIAIKKSELGQLLYHSSYLFDQIQPLREARCVIMYHLCKHYRPRTLSLRAWPRSRAPILLLYFLTTTALPYYYSDYTLVCTLSLGLLYVPGLWRSSEWPSTWAQRSVAKRAQADGDIYWDVDRARRTKSPRSRADCGATAAAECNSEVLSWRDPVFNAPALQNTSWRM